MISSGMNVKSSFKNIIIIIGAAVDDRRHSSVTHMACAFSVPVSRENGDPLFLGPRVPIFSLIWGPGVPIFTVNIGTPL